jgi:hypothetical protein
MAAQTISTSTNALATAHSGSQLVAMSASGDALVLWYDGSNVKWSYASSPYSSWTTATLVASSKQQYGIYKLSNDNVLAVVAQSTNMVSYLFTYNSGSHLWTVGSAVTVLASGVSTVGGNVGMDIDAQGRIWAAFEKGTTPVEVYYTSNNGTSWTASTTITEASGGLGQAVGLAYIGNYIVVTWCQTTSLVIGYSRIDAHLASLGSWSTATSVPNCVMDNALTDLCLRGAPGSNYGILIGDEYSAIPTQSYNAATDTWSAITNIGATSTAKNPTLVTDGTDLYAVWSAFSAANNFSLVYKKWKASNQTWDSSPTQLEANGTNIAWASGGYGNGSLAFCYAIGTASPWTVKFDTLAMAAPVALSVTLSGVGTLTGTMAANTALATNLSGVGTLTGTFSLSTTLIVTLSGVGTLTPTLAIIAWHMTETLSGVGTLSGTFSLATALSTTLSGVGTLTGTMAANTALTSTLSGVGTLSETFTLATALTDTLVGVGTLSATLSANTALAVTIPGTGTLTGTTSEATALSTTLSGIGTLTETFSLATALTVTFSGVGTLTPTLSTTGGVSLAVTLSGVGTLTGTFSLSTALSTTLQGIGTLSPSLSANTALTETIPGIGTLTGTFTLSTALSTTLSGVGTLSGIFSLTTALVVTMSGVGTLTGTMSASGQVALTVTMTGVGTLSPTLSANLALAPVTLAGVGQLAATLSLGTALSVSLVGNGTLSGVFTLRTALFVTFAGHGILTGVLGIPALSFLSATWVTRDMQATWTTRDENVAWDTRDEKASWASRDEQATWDTRDEQVTWKTRQ